MFFHNNEKNYIKPGTFIKRNMVEAKKRLLTLKKA